MTTRMASSFATCLLESHSGAVTSYCQSKVPLTECTTWVTLRKLQIKITVI